jgi:hypothetical protein
LKEYIFRKVNTLKDDVNMDSVFRETHKYYMEYLNDNNHIEAAEIGKYLYKKCGFIELNNEMELGNCM